MADKEPHSGANQETQSVQVHRKIWMEGWLIDMCRSGEKIVPQEEHRQGCVTACSPLNKCHREINKNASAVRISNKHARCLLSCTVCVYQPARSKTRPVPSQVRACMLGCVIIKNKTYAPGLFPPISASAAPLRSQRLSLLQQKSPLLSQQSWVISRQRGRPPDALL